MAEAGTLCINADVAKFAGANASATATAEGYTNVYIIQAEAFVCAQSQYDWVTNYASVSTIGKELLRNVTAAYAAIMCIEYNTAGFRDGNEAGTMLDVLYFMINEGITLLRDPTYRTFVLSGAIS